MAATVELTPEQILEAFYDDEPGDLPPTAKAGTESPGDAAAVADNTDPRARWTRAELEAQGFLDSEIGALVASGCVKDELATDGPKKPWWLAPETLDQAAWVVLRVKQMEDEKKALKAQYDRRIKSLDAKITVYKEQAWPECIEIVQARCPKGKKCVDHELLRLQLKTYSEKVKVADQAMLVTYMETLEANLADVNASLEQIPTDSLLLARKEELEAELEPLIDMFRLVIVTRDYVEGEEAWEIVGKTPIPGEGQHYEKTLDPSLMLEYVKNHEPEIAFAADENGVVTETKTPFSIPGVVRTEAYTELYAA